MYFGANTFVFWLFECGTLRKAAPVKIQVGTLWIKFLSQMLSVVSSYGYKNNQYNQKSSIFSAKTLIYALIVSKTLPIIGEKRWSAEPWLAWLCSINYTCYLLSNQIMFSTTLLQQQSPIYSEWLFHDPPNNQEDTVLVLWDFMRQNQSFVIVRSCPSKPFRWRYLHCKRCCCGTYTWWLTTKCFISFALWERCVNIQFLHCGWPDREQLEVTSWV